jgi:hypothetical protein
MKVSLTQYYYKHDNIIRECKPVSIYQGYNTGLFATEILIWFNEITVLNGALK